MSRPQNNPGKAGENVGEALNEHRLRQAALRSGQDEHTMDRLLRRVRKSDDDDALAAEFAEIREQMPAFRELPEHFAWEPLAADMKANIALGLEAGEAVKPRLLGPPLSLQARLVIAALTLLMISGYWWQMPRRQSSSAELQRAVLQTAPGQVGMSENDASFALVFPELQASTVFSGASGSMRADFVDDETGQLTVAHVYLD
jgi:hypothetical protein